MSNNGPVKIQVDSNLAQAGAVSNVATKQAETEALKQANVDGKSIRPEWVTARGLDLAESLRIGSGVSITDGTITSSMIGADQVNATHISATNLTTSEITFTGGSLSGFGIGTLGTITGGSLAIGSGGVTIGTAGSNLYLGGNMLIAYSGATPTITIDGTTGIVTCTKLVATLDNTSSMNLTAASITIGGTASLNGTAASTVVSNAAQGPVGVTNAATAQSAAEAANTNANGRITATQTYIGYTGSVITSIDLNGVAIRSGTSGARFLMDASGLAQYNSGGVVINQIDSTNGIWCNNPSSTADLLERISVAYNGSEYGYFCADAGGCAFESTNGQDMFIYSVAALSILSNTVDLTLNSKVKIGVLGPTLQATSAPSEGGASSEPLGSIRMGTGGSLWITYTDGSAKWTRVRTVQYNP